MLATRIAASRISHPGQRFIGIAFLFLLALAGALTLGGKISAPGVEARLGLAPSPNVAYAFVDGHVARIDATSGVVLAQTSEKFGDQFPSLAVSHDGKSVFQLHSFGDGVSGDRLTIYSARTLAPEMNVPVEHFMRPMGGGPSAVAVTADDRTIVVAEYGMTPNDPEWLSYIDRASGQYLPVRTDVSGCGPLQMLPVGEQLAVLCLGSGDLRLVDLRTHEVTAKLFPDSPETSFVGLPVAAGQIPGENALAVMDSQGNLVRVDLSTHQTALIAVLVPGNGRFRPVNSAAFSPGGRVAVTVSTNAEDRSAGQAMNVLVADVHTGRVLNRLLLPSEYDVSMSPDGQRVYLRGTDGEAAQVDLRTLSLQPFGADPRATGVRLAFPG